MINHWWTTRPKRKLISAVEMLRVFASVAEGKKWRRNRELHILFEDELERNEIKATGERRDRRGSGGRTYAAWLFSFGLWFVDSHGNVRLTYAGEDLVRSEPPVPILTRQVLNFQYPSAYSRKQGVKVHERFKIFPFRFLLRLLIDQRISSLTDDEILRFVMPFAETESKFQEIVDLIINYRSNPAGVAVTDELLESQYGKISTLKHVANTFVNQLEITQLIDRVRGDSGRQSRIVVKNERIDEVRRIVESRAVLLDRTDEEEVFQRKYGLGPHHRRDDRRFGEGPSITSRDVSRRLVISTLSQIILTSPIDSIDSGVIRAVAERTGVSEREIEGILDQAMIRPSFEAFEQTYLQYSIGDKALAKEFEKATEGIFGKAGLGFYTEWIGPKPNNPDVLAISIEPDSYIAIIDTKATGNYSLTPADRRAMTHEYIPKYRTYRHEENDYALAFFGYVAGGFKSVIADNLGRISRECGGSRGFAISATNLLQMLKKHKEEPYSKTRIREMFSQNRQILNSDLLQ